MDRFRRVWADGRKVWMVMVTFIVTFMATRSEVLDRVAIFLGINDHFLASGQNVEAGLEGMAKKVWIVYG